MPFLWGEIVRCAATHFGGLLDLLRHNSERPEHVRAEHVRAEHVWTLRTSSFFLSSAKYFRESYVLISPLSYPSTHGIPLLIGRILSGIRLLPFHRWTVRIPLIRPVMKELYDFLGNPFPSRKQAWTHGFLRSRRVFRASNSTCP